MIIGLKSALAMLRRKKMQSFLIGLTIMLTTLLIYIGLALMNQKTPFDKMYQRANGSENLIFLDSSVNNVNDIKNWLENYETVESVIKFSAYDSNVEFIRDNEKVSNNLLVTEFIEDSKQDIIYINEKEKVTSPKEGEIYITYNFANTNALKIGDTLNVQVQGQTYELTIAKLVVDPQFNNGFFNPFRCFVASEFFEGIDVNPTISLLGIKYNDYTLEKEKNLKKDFDRYMLDAIQPTFIEFSKIDSAYNMIGNIIAAAFILVSVFMFIIVTFIIRVTIRNQILQQYKIIGVRKVVGYSNKQIREMFIFMYLIIGIVASSVGAFIGVPIRNIFEELLTTDLQVDINTANFDYYFILTILIILSLLLLFVPLAANKANKIKPIQAIKYGMPQNKFKRAKFSVDRLQKAPLSIVLAIKQLLMDKKKSIMSIMSIMLITFVSLTISNITGSMSNARHFSKYLIGIKSGDITVTESTDLSIEEVINRLKNVGNVERVLYNTKELSVNTLSEDGTENIPLLGSIIYGDPDKNLIVLSEGRQPQTSNEVVISSLVAEKAGKSIGDYIIFKEGKGNDKYLITGIYESVMHSGFSYMMIKRHIPEDVIEKVGFYWLYMSTENVIIEEIEARIIDELGDEVTVGEFDSDTLQIASTIKTLPVVTNMILTIFLIVCGIIIFNWTFIDISRSTKVYGILKATGFSNRQLKILLIVKSLVLTLIGVLLGYSLCALTVDKTMAAMFAITPFSTIKLPVKFLHGPGIMIISLYGLMALIATLIPARKIGKISPINLISE